MLTVAYYRRSTTMQEHSIELQKYKAFEAARNHNLIVQKEFIDDAISARTTDINDREKLQELLEYVKNKKVKNLLVYKRDRLARNVIQHLKMYRLLREYDVNVIFTAEEELPMSYSSNGELYEIFIGCMVQLEGKQIHERLKAKREASFRAGKDPTNVPFGYSKENGVIVRQEQELALIKELYNQILDGKTLAEVSEYAKSKKTDRKWATSAIRNLLQNPTYMGFRVLKRKDEPDIHQEYKTLKVVSKETWNKAYEILEKTRAKPRKHRKHHFDYLLEGLVFCKRCDGNLLIGTQSQRPVYKCNKCKGDISKEKLENFIFEQVLIYIKSLLNNDYEKLIVQYQNRNQEVLNKRLQNENKSLEKLKFDLFNKIDTEIGNQSIDNKSIIEAYKKIKDQSKKIEELQNEIYQLKQLPRKMKKIKTFMMNKNTTEDMLNLKSRDILFDIIQSISIEEIHVDLVYKPPFSSLKEAHTIGT
jgi:site-specific DNA recombinase